MLINTPALAVTYEYIGNPLVSATGVSASNIVNHPLIIEFSTYNLLPANLTLSRGGQPASSVPIINWSVSIGAYQASGSGDPLGGTDLQNGNSYIASVNNDLYYFQFGTNSAGVIDGWFFETDPVTTDQDYLVNIVSSSLQNLSILGDYNDIAQVNPNFIGTSYISLAANTDPGSWYLIDSTPIAVPEPSSWMILLVGFVGLGLALRLERARRFSVAR